MMDDENSGARRRRSIDERWFKHAWDPVSDRRRRDDGGSGGGGDPRGRHRGIDRDPPYDRPPLSKALWKGGSLDDIWRPVAGAGAELRLGRRIEKLDLARRTAVDGEGTELVYEKLLLATGGRPRRLPFDDGGSVVYFRTVSDYRRLREAAQRGRRIAVVGGGFIGSEIAAALSQNGIEVVMAFPGKAIGDRIFPAPLADFVTSYYRERGVEVLSGTSIVGLERQGGRIALKVQGPDGAGPDVVVDGVVAGIGIEPNVELARKAGLSVEDGIVVDELLRTSHPQVWTAGDVAAFTSPALGKRMRVEHEDNASTMGRLAGRNMAGQAEPYRHLPFFYSDLFDLGYEAVGETDSRLETFADWKEPNREGVVYYLREGRVRGALLWNVWEKVDAARELIAAPGPYRTEELKGRLL
jgi:3-phenylpropionate/trans-cinnamate dioxygenase ferredoxin reductase subunit